MLAPLSPAFEAAGQVDVDDVEAAGAEVEVEGGDVDDHLVAGAHLAEQRGVGPGRPQLSVDLDGERVLVDDDAPPQLEAAVHAGAAAASTRMPSQTSSISSRWRVATHSSGVCGPTVPLASRTQSTPFTKQRVDVAAAAGRRPDRLDPGPSHPRLGDGERAR